MEGDGWVILKETKETLKREKIRSSKSKKGGRSNWRRRKKEVNTRREDRKGKEGKQMENKIRKRDEMEEGNEEMV